MISIRQNKYTAACYARLSVDDEQDGVSASIQTQNKILEDYCKTNGIEIYDFYCDDGFSGTNFNRPDFKRMIGDIEAGKVNMVIVKDLSRFGRSYFEVAQYLEYFFPNNQIRFVAIGDSYDSSENTRDLDFVVPIKNLFNQFHPAESSHKVRQAFKAKASRGEYIGSFAPYGYKKNAKDKHILEIDENASKTVIRIFELIAYHGYGYTKIARTFSEEKILTPLAYRMQCLGKDFDKNPYDWNLGSVAAIVNNEVYLGNLISGKRTTVSFKNHTVIKQSREDCIVVEGVIPQIISRELWNSAHARVNTRKRTTNDGSFTNIFAGLIRCDKCGKVLGLSGRQNKDNDRSYYYCCETYKKKGKDRCSVHYTKYNDIYDAVLKDIRSVTTAVKNLDPDSDERLAKELFGEFSNNDGTDEKRIAEIEKQIAGIDAKLDSMYEDRLSGIISAERYKTYAAKEEEHAKALREELEKLKSRVKAHENADQRFEAFLETVRSFGKIKKLDANLLNTLVDSITIGERELIGGKYMQKIMINYKFCS